MLIKCKNSYGWQSGEALSHVWIVPLAWAFGMPVLKDLVRQLKTEKKEVFPSNWQAWWQ